MERLPVRAEPTLSPATRDFLAGGIAGTVSVVAGSPFDVVRIRLQQPNNEYRSLYDGLRRIVAAEGVRGLFKGMASPVATVSLQNAVVFYAYGISERLLRSRDPTLAYGSTPSPLSVVFAAGCMAGLVQTAVVTPVDLLKVRLQTQSPTAASTAAGPIRLARHIWQTEGARGLFRGLPITAVRDFPSHGVYFALYELCQSLQVYERGEETPLSTFVAGGAAGIVSWWSVYPFDVIKSRIQASTGARIGWMTVAASCVREEGWVRAATLPQWVPWFWRCRDWVERPGELYERRQGKAWGFVSILAFSWTFLHTLTTQRRRGDDVQGALVRGIGATTIRAFLVNGVIFSGYEGCMRVLSGF